MREGRGERGKRGEEGRMREWERREGEERRGERGKRGEEGRMREGKEGRMREWEEGRKREEGGEMEETASTLKVKAHALTCLIGAENVTRSNGETCNEKKE